MSVPADYAIVTVEFIGLTVPNGAACTFAIGNAFSAVSVSAQAQLIHQNWVESILPKQTSNTTLDRVTVKNGPSATGQVGEYASVVSGGNSSAGTSPQVAYLAKKVTALGGRRNRGRMYIPGVGEPSVNDSGEIVGDYVTEFPTALESFFDKMAADSLPLYLAHGDGGLPTALTALLFDQRVATQRRRLR